MVIYGGRHGDQLLPAAAHFLALAGLADCRTKSRGFSPLSTDLLFHHGTAGVPFGPRNSAKPGRGLCWSSHLGLASAARRTRRVDRRRSRLWLWLVLRFGIPHFSSW